MIEGVPKKPRGRPRKETIEASLREKKSTPLVEKKSEDSIADYYEKNYGYLFQDDDFYPLTSPIFKKEFEHLEETHPLEHQTFKESPEAILGKITRKEVVPTKKRIENHKTLTLQKQERTLLGKLRFFLEAAESKILGSADHDDEWLDEFMDK